MRTKLPLLEAPEFVVLAAAALVSTGAWCAARVGGTRQGTWTLNVHRVLNVHRFGPNATGRQDTVRVVRSRCRARAAARLLPPARGRGCAV